MKICPECQIPQTTNSPFCESCGYRLRSAETALEGLPAISPEMLRASKLRRPERVATEEEPSVPTSAHRARATEEALAIPASASLREAVVAPTSAVNRARRATHQEHPAVSSDVRARGSLEESDLEPGVPPSMTIVEGIKAVERRDGSSSSEAPSASPSSSQSFIGALPGQTPRRSNIVFVGVSALLIGGMAGAVIAWSVAPRGGADDASGATAAPLARAEVPGGDFTRGLDEQTRSLLLQTCYKVSDTPDEQCEQDVLLEDEYPQETVAVPSFSIDSNEVTVARYGECVEAGGCDAIDYKKCKVYTTQGFQVALRVPKALQRPEGPVVCATRAQAAAFCAWAGGALPTHDQWEKAARGDEDGRLFPWGDTWSPTFANWGEVDLVKTSIVGKVDGFEWTAPPGVFLDGDSAFELHDMAGNVAEWVRGDGEAGVARGGSWRSDPFELRVTGRLEVSPRKGRTDVGFRCVYD